MTHKNIFLAALTASTISAFSQQNQIEAIKWPQKYEPKNASFHIRNEKEINAAPEVVWKELIDAKKWPTWYKGAKNVSFVNPSDSVLRLSAVFKWETMGLKIQSQVQQFEPYKALAWDFEKKSIQGYHAWLIIPTKNGCKVVTEESQNGWLTFFEKLFTPNKLRKYHDIWLMGLKKRSEQR